jgi:hypothetical protein
MNIYWMQNVAVTVKEEKYSALRRKYWGIDAKAWKQITENACINR